MLRRGKMNWDSLKLELKENRFNNIYLFYGEEQYAIKDYIKRFKDALVEENYKMFNYIVLEGSNIEKDIISNVTTLPMLSEHKMVVLKNTKLFEGAGKHEELLDVLKNIDSTIHVFFVEEKVNKTVTLYKRLKEYGATIIDFQYMNLVELRKWLILEFKKSNIKIDNSTIDYLVNYVGSSMEELEKEVNKLCNYVGYGNEVKQEMVDKVCTKTLQAKVFDMLDAISNKNKEKAFNLLKDMLILKEPIQKIIVLVARQFRIMYLVKELKNKDKSSSEIAKILKIAPFVVTKTMSQVNNYTIEELQDAIKDILDLDCKIKTGKIDAVIGLETFISKY